MKLDVSDIHLIKTVAGIGSVNKAAEVLHISQPTLSKRLSRLEQVLGASLFHRHNGGMIATEVASYIIAKGEGLTSQINVIERQVEMMASLLSGSLSVGVGPIIEQLFFPKVILDFVEETRNVELSLRTESAEQLLELLAAGEIDIAIGPFATNELNGEYQVFPVKTSEIILVARSDHPIFTYEPDEILGKLRDYPSIAPTIPTQMSRWVDQFNLSGIPKIKCDNYTTSKSVIMVSDYISGGPELVFRRELESGQCKKIPLNVDVKWSSYCVTRPESMHSPVVEKFLSILSRYTDEPIPID